MGKWVPILDPLVGKAEDPISLLLFNAAVDTLAEILERAKRSGHLSGVVSHLILGVGVTHL